MRCYSIHYFSRLLIVGLLILFCNQYIGFQALKGVLIDEGMFYSYCGTHNGTSSTNTASAPQHHETCDEQNFRIDIIFQTGLSAYCLAAVFVGVVMDFCAAKWRFGIHTVYYGLVNSHALAQLLFVFCVVIRDLDDFLTLSAGSFSIISITEYCLWLLLMKIYMNVPKRYSKYSSIANGVGNSTANLSNMGFFVFNVLYFYVSKNFFVMFTAISLFSFFSFFIFGFFLVIPNSVIEKDELEWNKSDLDSKDDEEKEMDSVQDEEDASKNEVEGEGEGEEEGEVDDEEVRICEKTDEGEEEGFGGEESKVGITVPEAEAEEVIEVEENDRVPLVKNEAEVLDEVEEENEQNDSKRELEEQQEEETIETTQQSDRCLKILKISYPTLILTIWFSLAVLQLNFYISTVFDQAYFMGGEREELGEYYADIFSIVFPLAAFTFSLLFGVAVIYFKFAVLLLLFLNVTWTVLSMLPYLSIQYFIYFFYSLSNCFTYVVFYEFLSHIYGMKYFATVSTILHTVAGIISFVSILINWLAIEVLHSYVYANFVLGVMSIFAHLLLVFLVFRDEVMRMCSVVRK